MLAIQFIYKCIFTPGAVSIDMHKSHGYRRSSTHVLDLDIHNNKVTIMTVHDMLLLHANKLALPLVCCFHGLKQDQCTSSSENVQNLRHACFCRHEHGGNFMSSTVYFHDTKWYFVIMSDIAKNSLLI